MGEMERHLARGSLKWYVGDEVAYKQCACVPPAVACHDKGCAGRARVLLTRTGVCISQLPTSPIHRIQFISALPETLPEPFDSADRAARDSGCRALTSLRLRRAIFHGARDSQGWEAAAQAAAASAAEDDGGGGGGGATRRSKRGGPRQPAAAAAVAAGAAKGVDLLPPVLAVGEDGQTVRACMGTRRPVGSCTEHGAMPPAHCHASRGWQAARALRTHTLVVLQMTFRTGCSKADVSCLHSWCLMWFVGLFVAAGSRARVRRGSGVLRGAAPRAVQLRGQQQQRAAGGSAAAAAGLLAHRAGRGAAGGQQQQRGGAGGQRP